VPITLPDKLYYKIGEVAEVAGVRTSVLRFWESEFAFLKPEKSPTGQRLYSKDEIELIVQLKRLLYEEKFTIEGVKKRISSRGKLLGNPEGSRSLTSTRQELLLREIRRDLVELRALI
jgi:DNA-binding transcriptional MerR regulator